MSIQYTVRGFEPTTFGTRVSSHNHKTRPPAQLIETFAFRIRVVATDAGSPPMSSETEVSVTIPTRKE